MLREGTMNYAPDEAIVGGDSVKENESKSLAVDVSLQRKNGEIFEGKIKLEQAIESELTLIIKNPDDFNVQVIIMKDNQEILNLEGNLNDPILNMQNGMKRFVYEVIAASNKCVDAINVEEEKMRDNNPENDGLKNVKMLLDLIKDENMFSLTMGVNSKFNLDLDKESLENLHDFIAGKIDREEYVPKTKEVSGLKILEEGGIQRIEGLNVGDYVRMRKIESRGSAVPAGSVISGQLLHGKITAPGPSIYLGSTSWGATNWTSPPVSIDIENGYIVIRTMGGAYRIEK